MNEDILKSLIDSGTIKSYSLTTLDEDGFAIDNEEGSRNTERLVIEFNDGRTLSINTFCSGSLENTVLILG